MKSMFDKVRGIASRLAAPIAVALVTAAALPGLIGWRVGPRRQERSRVPAFRLST